MVKLHHSNFKIFTSVSFSSVQFFAISIVFFVTCHLLFEPQHNKTNNMTCVPSKDSDQPRHPPSLIRVFAVRMKKPWVLSYPLSVQRRLWSDWADAQADLSLCWMHRPYCWFCHAVAHLSVSRKLGCKFLSIRERDMCHLDDSSLLADGLLTRPG